MTDTMNISAKQATYQIPAGFELVNPMAVKHPTNPLVLGALCRNINTGVYVIISAGSISTCPQKWAAQNVAK